MAGGDGNWGVVLGNTYVSCKWNCFLYLYFQITMGALSFCHTLLPWCPTSPWALWNGAGLLWTRTSEPMSPQINFSSFTIVLIRTFSHTAKKGDSNRGFGCLQNPSRTWGRGAKKCPNASPWGSHSLSAWWEVAETTKHLWRQLITTRNLLVIYKKILKVPVMAAQVWNPCDSGTWGRRITRLRLTWETASKWKK